MDASPLSAFARDGDRLKYDRPSPADQVLEPRPGRRGDAIDDARLRSVVEGAVIPMLLERCRTPAQTRRRPSALEVDALARGALSRDSAAASAQVSALFSEGVDIESLFNDLIAPAALRLGEYWHADAADFVEVALASQRLLAIVRALGEQLERAHPAPMDAPLAIVGSPVAERHAMGALIVAHSFRAAGWRVREAPGFETPALVRAVRAEDVAMVGLSVCSERALDELPETVARLRSASRNRRLIVALGGAAIAAAPSRADGAGADFVASDARDAVRKAGELLSPSIP